MVKPRELSVCVQVLDVHVEPDFLHLSWEVQVLVYFSDPSLKGVPEQTTGTSGKVFGSTRKRKKKGSKKDLWESVPRQFFIANAVDIHNVRPDKFRVLNASLGTCKQTTHVRVRTYSPIDVRDFPYDRQDLKLMIQATYPIDIAIFGKQPVFYLANRIKRELIPLNRAWKVEAHGIQTGMTPKHESFTSSSYATLDVSLSVARRPSAASRVTMPFANVCVLLSWTSVAVNDPDTGFMLLLLTIVAMVSLMLASTRPPVAYLVAMDIYIRDCFLAGIFPVAVIHAIVAFLARFNVLNEDAIQQGRLGGVAVSMALFLARTLRYSWRMMKKKNKEDFELELKKSGQPNIDLPKDMSVFTLWEMNRFLKAKQDSSAKWLGSSWFDRSDAEDGDDNESESQRGSPYKMPKSPNSSNTGQPDGILKNSPKKKKKLPPLFSDTRRNTPNLSSSADEGGNSDGGMSGQEEWIRGKSGNPDKNVHFEPLGGLQDNKIRNKIRPSSALRRVK